MDAETLFYILGISLTAMALVISFVGIRLESFPPSRPVMLAGVGVFLTVIGATAVFAWEGAEDEQEHRVELIAAGEEPSPAEVVAEFQAAADERTAEAAGEAPAGGETAGGDETASADGAALFDDQGCASCHALDAAGSTATVGPDLDATLKGQDLTFIEESIVDPEAEIAKGFAGGIMPSNFGETLTPEELEALVSYIADSVGIKG